MVNIYLIKCESGKYYVGKSSNLTTRLDDHKNEEGSEWTKKYPILKVKRIICNKSNWYEDIYTIKMMKKYGMENVRGGSFCQVILNKHEKIIIRRMIATISDSCFTCGGSGHFAKQCPESPRINEIIRRSRIPTDPHSEDNINTDEQGEITILNSHDQDEPTILNTDNEIEIGTETTGKDNNSQEIEAPYDNKINETHRTEHSFVRGCFRVKHRGILRSNVIDGRTNRKPGWSCTSCGGYTYGERDKCYYCNEGRH